MSQIEKLITVSETEKEFIRKVYNKSKENVKEDLNILLDWLSKQPHLPQPHDVHRLERSLIRNKFRIEQTKVKQDKYYTYRGLYPDYFKYGISELTALEASRKATKWVLMPQLLPTGERLFVYWLNPEETDKFDFKTQMSEFFMFVDLQLSYDYELSDRFLFDLNGFSLSHLSKMDPTVFANGLSLYQQAFSGRISKFEFINIPSIFDLLLILFKKVFSAKLYGKIRTHNDLDSVYKVIQKEYLPKEYGGNQPSIYELHDQWGKELIYQKKFLEEHSKRISNEKLRIGKPIHNELFGMDGTFKKINLD